MVRRASGEGHAAYRVRHTRVLLSIILRVFCCCCCFFFNLIPSLLFDIFFVLSASGWQLVCRPFGWQVPVVWFPVLKPSPFSLQEKSFFVFVVVLLSFFFRERGNVYFLPTFLFSYSILRASGLAAVTVERQSRRCRLQPSLTQPTPANSRHKRTKEPIDTKRLIDFSRDRIHLTRAQLFFYIILSRCCFFPSFTGYFPAGAFQQQTIQPSKCYYFFFFLSFLTT